MMTMLAALLLQAAGTFSAEEANGAVTVRLRGVPVAVYQAAERDFPAHPHQRRAGYFRELRSPAGVLLSEDGPGDHLHHRGLFLTWNRVTWEEDGRPAATANFWELTEASGRKAPGRVSAVSAPGADASFCMSHEWRMAGRTCLEESLRCRAHEPFPGAVALDLDFTLEAKGGPVTLDEYGHRSGKGPWYGTLGLRGAAGFDPKELRFLYAGRETAESPKDNARLPGAWVALQGVLEGGPRGAALVVRPGSPPCRLSHFRSLRFLDADASDPAPLRLMPGTPLRLSFRAVVWDGTAEPARLDALAR